MSTFSIWQASLIMSSGLRPPSVIILVWGWFRIFNIAGCFFSLLRGRVVRTRMALGSSARSSRNAQESESIQ